MAKETTPGGYGTALQDTPAEVVRERALAGQIGGPTIGANVSFTVVTPQGLRETVNLPAIDHKAMGRKTDPAFDRSAVPATGRDEPADRRQGIEVFHDDAGIEQGTAIFGDKAGHLAQGVDFLDLAVRRPDVLDLHVEVEFLFGHDNADFAHEGAGQRGEQFHDAINLDKLRRMAVPQMIRAKGGAPTASSLNSGRNQLSLSRTDGLRD